MLFFVTPPAIDPSLKTTATQNYTFSNTIATAFEHLKVADLTKDELDAALECEKQLNNLRFRQQDDYEVCDDNKGLESASRTFIDKFAPWSKVELPRPPKKCYKP